MLGLYLVLVVHNIFEIKINLRNLQIKNSHRKFIYSKKIYLPK